MVVLYTAGSVMGVPRELLIRRAKTGRTATSFGARVEFSQEQ